MLEQLGKMLASVFDGFGQISLFPRTNYMSGGVYQDRLHRYVYNPNRTDAEALQADWDAITDDFERAYEDAFGKPVVEPKSPEAANDNFD